MKCVFLPLCCLSVFNCFENEKRKKSVQKKEIGRRETTQQLLGAREEKELERYGSRCGRE